MVSSSSSSPRRRALLLLFVFASSFFASAAAAVSRTNSSSAFVLAAAQTRRKDPLRGLRYYTGGWNISDKHYLASVGFSAAPVFVVAAVWFASLALAAFVACCCRCCCSGAGGGNGNGGYSYSRAIFAVSLALLLVFTAVAIIGCIVLYDGQGKFHGSTTATLRFVVNQSDGAVASLRGFSGFIEAAKAAAVEKATLPADLQGKVDDVVRRVDASADDLAARTTTNSRKIRTALETIRTILIVVAAVMLALAFLGLVFSLCGLKSLVYTLVIFGWILVTATFILSGTFLLLHNAVGDTCVAMDEWVLHPQGHTALDDILPCVDAAATSDALRRSKEVNYQIVSVLNNLLATVANANVPASSPPSPPASYRQSGTPVPLLCNPYNGDLSDRACAAGEVAAADAPRAWRGYVCRATGAAPSSEVCATTGRLTPTMYDQMVAAANASAGLTQYGPVLADLADCSYVRRAFQAVTAAHCPGLRRHSGRVYQALLAVSVAVAAAVAAWVAHSQERRRRSETRRFQVSPYRFPIEEKSLLKSPRRPYRRGDSGRMAR
ncbi:uncharacterized protein [Oryza sativa Japonica Group]|uniref:uncharacterized protein n=1 Tax=Oryza sativa subsp. japonica TaxID=39947 RepID=UPI0001C7C589|nr:uncharacterized protein LOC4341654 [Oryza sativa Japonica Group]KAF2927799.1 hypothetical protein DAI22_06g231900 [Oryza sativa Japonica Group]